MFSTLVHVLNSSGTVQRIGLAVAGLLRAYWPATILSMLAAGAVLLSGAGVLGAVLLLPIALVIAIGTWVYFDVTRRLVANGFGMCSGLTSDKDGPALTPWLHALIQRTAGLAAEDPPLTFGMLWDAPGFPPAWMTSPKSLQPRSIDLQMFSTNLGHGRPYIFPWRQMTKPCRDSARANDCSFVPRNLRITSRTTYVRGCTTMDNRTKWKRGGSDPTRLKRKRSR